MGAPTSSTAIQAGGSNAGRTMAQGAETMGKAVQSRQLNELMLEQHKLQNKKIQAETDFINQQANDSVFKRAQISANEQQDVNEAHRGVADPYISPYANAEAREEEMGEILGEVANLRRAAGMVGRKLHSKRDKTDAGYIMDKRTGRVMKNPKYKPRSRRGRNNPRRRY